MQHWLPQEMQEKSSILEQLLAAASAMIA